MKKLSIGIIGISGNMGKTLKNIILKNPLTTLAGGLKKSSTKKDFFEIFKKSDVLIDFSSKDALNNILETAEKFKKPIIIGTTGFSNAQLKQLKNFSKKIPILYSENFSFGIASLLEMLKPLKNLSNFSIKITETHHKNKKDKPSGTALLLSKTLKKHKEEEIPIYSFRIKNIIGKHKITFSNKEEVLEITHIAKSKKIFAKGALLCAKFIYKKKPGLYYIKDFLEF
jgi:4-hydroxy-tetrahydrodipicolinate reductase